MTWKKVIITCLDALLAVYLVLAITSFNKPDEGVGECTKVTIDITDSNNAGFLSAAEVKNMLLKRDIYPLHKPMPEVNPRSIEESLKKSPFVNTAECYKTQQGQVAISVTQRMPIVRIKSQSGDDYYLDDQGGILPNSHYTSDLVIATGNINKWYARYYITPLSKTIMNSELWNNQIEQINILPDRGVELVPRMGNHVVYIGQLPQYGRKPATEKEIDEYVATKLSRLEKFYRYGLSQAGWNRYDYINIEFDNQIICKKRVEKYGAEQ